MYFHAHKEFSRNNWVRKCHIAIAQISFYNRKRKKEKQRGEIKLGFGTVDKWIMHFSSKLLATFSTQLFLYHLENFRHYCSGMNLNVVSKLKKNSHTCASKGRQRSITQTSYVWVIYGVKISAELRDSNLTSENYYFNAESQVMSLGSLWIEEGTSLTSKPNGSKT